MATLGNGALVGRLPIKTSTLMLVASRTQKPTEMRAVDIIREGHGFVCNAFCIYDGRSSTDRVVSLVRENNGSSKGNSGVCSQPRSLSCTFCVCCIAVNSNSSGITSVEARLVLALAGGIVNSVGVRLTPALAGGTVNSAGMELVRALGGGTVNSVGARLALAGTTSRTKGREICSLCVPRPFVLWVSCFPGRVCSDARCRRDRLEGSCLRVGI